MMLASLEAGLAFSNASLGAVHALAHSLGGLLDTPHGECNALLLPHVIDFNFEAVPERYNRIAGALGLATLGMTDLELRTALHSRIACLLEAAGITHTLSQLGVSRSDIRLLAGKALDPCMFTNPRLPSREDIEAIYERAF
jgi:alcohol dehydrogenase class IV